MPLYSRHRGTSIRGEEPSHVFGGGQRGGVEHHAVEKLGEGGRMAQGQRLGMRHAAPEVILAVRQAV